MSDEISGKSHPLTPDSPNKETRLGYNFFKKIFPFLKTSPKSDTILTGRIHKQLQHDAHAAIVQLKKLREILKKELEGHDDQHLWTSFEAIVNPLLREYDQLERKLFESQEPKDLKCYHTWIEKAKLWVSVLARPHDRESITQTVVTHTQQVSHIIIDRDLKMLEEYMINELHHLGFDQEKLSKLASQIHEEIAPHIKGLLDLKHNKPEDLTLSTLQSWKARINSERAKHYNAALHIIDDKLQVLAPASKQEEESEHLKDIFSLVIYLEAELPTFLEELEKIDLDDATQLSLFADHSVYLEEQIHKLNQDLRLTPELFDRVQVMMMDLDEARKILEQKNMG